jgi:SAM-dependent MidA family methyltransferase
MRPDSLPAPERDALEASGALVALLRREIAASGGWISFARYMELALHAPGLGYYAGGASKLGAEGDFVTAPQLGPLFARTLARQVGTLLEAVPGGAILEFGAGSGALAADLLDALGAAGAAPEYLILETSAGLRERQRRRLGDRARWIDRVPQRFRGVALANEVLDAMPVHAVAWTPEGVLERGVAADGNALRWADRPAAGALLDAARAIAPGLPRLPRYESEIGLAGRAWMRSVGERLEAGAILVIDYGFPQREYYHPQRSAGTLMCHYRHRAHGDVFLHPGLQDITAHVDFSALAQAASGAGLETLGYATQAGFLLDCGITALLAEADPADAKRYAPLAAAAHTLLSPAEMGELFKVLAVGRGVAAPLPGFARADRSHAL